jgi:peptidyl-prolyl cis-trans isomerase SurA
MSMIRSAALLWLAVTLVPAPASAVAPTELVDQVVAVVNKKLILQSDVDEIMAMVGEDEFDGLSDDERRSRLSELQTTIIDTLIGEELMEQAMDRGGVKIGDREVESAIADVARQNKLSVEDLMEQLQRQGMSADQYRREMKKQIRQYRFMELEIRSRINISEEDVRAHYQRTLGSVDPEPAWQLQRILLTIPKEGDAAAVAAVSEEAAVLLTQLLGGKDFAEVARVRSDDPATREQGGDAGVFKKKDLSSAFRDALESAEVGQPVRVDTPRGIFLLRVVDEVDAGIKEFEEVRVRLSRKLHDAAMQRELELWTAEQRRRAHVEVFL